MFNGLLPIGTVVLLKNSTKKVMIMGFCQVSAKNPGVVWDYTGCVFPEGFLGPDQMFMFNNEQIEQVFAVGYQDQEQMAFKIKVDEAIREIRNNGTKEIKETE